MLTPEQKAALSDRIASLRMGAKCGGSMHANYELILTAQDLIAGRGHWPYDSVEEAFAQIMEAPQRGEEE